MDLAYDEFQAAREIFLNINLPVETCLALVHLARIRLLERRIVRSGQQAGILSRKSSNPLVRSNPWSRLFSNQEDLLSCLEEHLPEDPFTRDLVREVSSFQSRLPGLLEKLEFNILPV